MANTWAEFYFEMVRRPQLRYYNDQMLSLFVKFLFATGDHFHDGLLAPLPELARTIHMQQRKVLRGLQLISMTRLAERTPLGWKLVNPDRPTMTIEDRMAANPPTQVINIPPPLPGTRQVDFSGGVDVPAPLPTKDWGFNPAPKFAQRLAKDSTENKTRH
jgi:hypothetical protein